MKKMFRNSTSPTFARSSAWVLFALILAALQGCGGSGGGAAPAAAPTLPVLMSGTLHLNAENRDVGVNLVRFGDGKVIFSGSSEITGISTLTEEGNKLTIPITLHANPNNGFLFANGRIDVDVTIIGTMNADGSMEASITGPDTGNMLLRANHLVDSTVEAPVFPSGNYFEFNPFKSGSLTGSLNIDKSGKIIRWNGEPGTFDSVRMTESIIKYRDGTYFSGQLEFTASRNSKDCVGTIDYECTDENFSCVIYGNDLNATNPFLVSFMGWK